MRSIASWSIAFDPRPMNTCRITGSTSLVRSDKPELSVGHVAPAEHDLALAHRGALDFLLARHARGGLLGKKNHADAILADRGQGKALTAAGASQEGVGQLDEDARAVALERVRARRPAVREVLEDLQALADDRVAFGALDVRDEPQAASVVLVGRIVESLPQGG